MHDGSVLTASRALTVDIDAPHVSVDETARRPTADLPATQQLEMPLVRAEMPQPSAAERIEAYEHTRLAVDKAYAKLIAEENSEGYAFDKHVIERGEFPGVTTRRQFASLIEDVVMNGESRVLSGGRTAYWNDGTLVIRNPDAPDGGTTFRPTDGHDYFLGMH